MSAHFIIPCSGKSVSVSVTTFFLKFRSFCGPGGSQTWQSIGVSARILCYVHLLLCQKPRPLRLIPKSNALPLGVYNEYMQMMATRYLWHAMCYRLSTAAGALCGGACLAPLLEPARPTILDMRVVNRGWHGGMAVVHLGLAADTAADEERLASCDFGCGHFSGSCCSAR